MANVEFEVTTTSVDDAKAKIAEIREKIGEGVYVTVKIVYDGRNKSFDLHNNGMEKFFSIANKKLKEEK